MNVIAWIPSRTACDRLFAFLSSEALNCIRKSFRMWVLTTAVLFEKAVVTQER